MLKDLNFKTKIYLDPADRADLMAQIKIDVDFLKCFGIMDYSLLLGIALEHDDAAKGTKALLRQELGSSAMAEESRGGHHPSTNDCISSASLIYCSFSM